MAKYTGKDGYITCGGTTINVIDWSLDEQAVMEDSVDTASAEVDSLIVDEQEAVAIALTGTVNAFHNDDETIHSDPPDINAGSSVSLVLYERTGKTWTITAVITRVRMALGAKRHTKFSFDFRASTWTRPSS